jgi:outer membrane protein OmpA-like peptidoglycan-associated protein
MKLRCALGASLLLLAAVPAAAASFPGEEVTVNPGAFGNGYLLYPGGKYGRHVGPLLQPGDRGGAIHLHLPRKHVATHVKPRAPRVAAAPDCTITIPAEVPATPLPETPPAPPPPKRVAHTAPPRATPPRQTAAAAPPPAAPTQSLADPNALPEDSAARLLGSGDTTPAAPPPPAAAPVKPAKPVKPPRMASATPPPANTTTPPAAAAGLRRQSVIPFAAGSSSPAASDVNAIHSLAATLNAALNAGAARVQLEAYGGPRGDKSSDSRRLSLKRALVVRELLIEDGVPSEKIDVRAMGGADDAGAADRVDVFVRA